MTPPIQPAPARQAESRQARVRQAHARPRREAAALSVLPYVAVLACAAVGLYLASRGPASVIGGMVIAGCGLLTAAAARLVLPKHLAGLLACRSRVLDVLTLAMLGISLIIMGLVLPRLRAAIRTRGMAGPV
jgi:hypothetical protein